MLVTSAGSALGSAGIETLFFTRFGVRFLPHMYMLLGIVTMVLSLAVTAWFARLAPRRLYVLLPLLLTLSLLLARLLLFFNFPLLYPVLWLGKEIIGTFIGILVWGAASSACDPRQARRLFPLFGAGRILGSVLGGLSTAWLVNWIGTENLLLPWAASTFLALIFTRMLFAMQPVLAPEASRRGKQPGVVEEIRRGYRYIRSSELMRWISLASALFSVLYFSLALPFSRVSALQFPDEAALAGFLGAFQGVSTAAAFLASLFLANRLFSRFGIMSMILLFPLIYLLGFGAMAIAPVFAVIVVFRFVQNLWLSGIADPAYQAMFNVLPPERRDQVRTFMTGIPDQAGTFIAGLALFLGQRTLSPSQLALVGFFASAACVYTIWRARVAYNAALMDALRQGRPQVFFSEEEPFGGFRNDAAAIAAVAAGTIDEDLAVRRVSTEILEHMHLPQAAGVLLHALQDTDAHVRLHALKALSGVPALDVPDKIVPLLQDPDPAVRIEAIDCLLNAPVPVDRLRSLAEPMLDDKDLSVQVHAAAALLKTGPHERAHRILQDLVSSGEDEARVQALSAIRGDFELIASQLSHPHVSVRKAAISALRRVDAPRALPVILPLLADPDLRTHVAAEIGRMGENAWESILQALLDPAAQAGALDALSYLPVVDPVPIEAFARAAVTRALHYDGLLHALHDTAPRALLLRDLLREKAEEHGVLALKAISLLTRRDAISLAIENLTGLEPAQRAHVLEILDSLDGRSRAIIRPLLVLWDDAPRPATSSPGASPFAVLLGDPDPWVRDCASFAARPTPEGESSMDTVLPTLSLMERVLFFRHVPLFAGLNTLELKNVAAIAAEMVFTDGEPIALQGEAGDIMHLVISGEIQVVTELPGGGTKDLGRRGPGQFVGEMALISNEPRMANLVACGDVRTLSIDRRSFHSLLRERPEVGLAVMQELSSRIKHMAQMG
jgi:AAA family ATP:ADP antiporter